MRVGWAHDNGGIDPRIVEHREGIRIPSLHVQLSRSFLRELRIRVSHSRQAHADYSCCQVTRIHPPEPAEANQAYIQFHRFPLNTFLAAVSSGCGKVADFVILSEARNLSSI